jgi:hypothetical protein
VEVLWFSRVAILAKNANFAAIYGKFPRHDYTDPEPSPLEQIVVQSWPSSLGMVRNADFGWNCGFAIKYWRFYRGDGRITFSMVE